jgi:hypothetical protein
VSKQQKQSAGGAPSFLDKSLEALEGKDWGEPDYGSYVVRTSYSLRKKPLASLTNEELRLALSQQLGLPWIMELALVRLRETLRISGDFYPGDVLVNALKVDAAFWANQTSLRAEFQKLAAQALATLGQFDEWDRETVRKEAEQFLTPH